MTASRRPITRHLVIACSLAGLLLGVAPRASGPDTDVRRVKRQVYLMGTRATLVTLAPDRGTGLRQLEWMLQALESTEHELSTWDSDSLISRLNHHPVGQPWSAPAPLCELFDDVFRWYRDTGGAFDPAVGPLLDAWGTRQRGYRPTAAALADARARTGLGHFVFRPGTCDVTRVADASLDSGAFGKGAALDRVVGQGRARETAPWMIDLGGQVAVSGVPVDGSWPVAIAHPVHRTETAFELALTMGSVAVSGGSERDRWVDDEPIGHIVDPRTGRPVNRDASVVVWHPRALVADVLATALYVMGVDEGLRWAESQGVAACFLLPNGSPRSARDLDVRATGAFQRRFLDSPREPRNTSAIP